jgi:hypothetical protein
MSDFSNGTGLRVKPQRVQFSYGLSSLPALCRQAGSAHPVAALADISEEDIWLANQKSKRTHLQTGRIAFHAPADDSIV